VFAATTDAIPRALALSLTLIGFFAASSSADVWQRIYAARSVHAARRGFVFGAAALFGFGVLLVLVGLIARTSMPGIDPNQAFGSVMTESLPPWAATAAILLVLTTVMSTADTEMFLLGGLAVREIAKFKGRQHPADVAASISVSDARLAVITCSISAALFALFVTNLVQVYTWLITGLLVLAPTIVSSLFVRQDRLAGTMSLFVSATTFIGLAASAMITPDTAYLVLLPGFAAYALGIVLARRTA
jgi:Na+/proline symporter